jgi:hypothetical protein
MAIGFSFKARCAPAPDLPFERVRGLEEYSTFSLFTEREQAGIIK